MDQASQRDLRILTEIAERQDVTQRGLSKSLGIALGLTNLYLKRLARKGYIKITTIPPNRIKYLLTPQGFSEKSRLTYEYVTLSLGLYRETRQRLRSAMEPMLGDGLKRLALYGTGEAAELAYLTLREMGFEPLAVYEDDGPATFLGMPVHQTAQLREAEFDRVVVASFRSATDGQLVDLRRLVPEEKLIFIDREHA